MRALIIDTPHIDRVLAGIKTWEMRSRLTRIRGEIGLIRKGSGLVVGVTQLVDSLPALTEEERRTSKAFHQIDDETLSDPATQKWRFPWVLHNTRTLSTPVPYVHPQGAVIWVTLEDVVVQAVRATLPVGV